MPSHGETDVDRLLSPTGAPLIPAFLFGQCPGRQLTEEGACTTPAPATLESTSIPRPVPRGCAPKAYFTSLGADLPPGTLAKLAYTPAGAVGSSPSKYDGSGLHTPQSGSSGAHALERIASSVFCLDEPWEAVASDVPAPPQPVSVPRYSTAAATAAEVGARYTGTVPQKGESGFACAEAPLKVKAAGSVKQTKTGGRTPASAREKFMADVYRIQEQKGTSIQKLPTVGSKELNLFLLYNQVMARGGVAEVVKGKQWKSIASALKLPTTCTDYGFRLRKHYQRYLLDYENGADGTPVVKRGVKRASKPAKRKQNAGDHAFAQYAKVPKRQRSSGA
jgi:hypothetical protein